jgi:hypothetical protein
MAEDERETARMLMPAGYLGLILIDFSSLSKYIQSLTESSLAENQSSNELGIQHNDSRSEKGR